MTSPCPQECNFHQEYAPDAILGQDGYVRLAIESFQHVEMVHLFSGMDEDRPVTIGTGASSHPITGYTEWVSPQMPAISIGWDWELIGMKGRAQLVQTGTPGSNMMLVDQHGYDLGLEQTRILILSWLHTFGWQAKTLEAITATPSSCQL